MDIETHRVLPSAEVIRQARDVYRDAFAEPPYEEPPESADAFVERVERYAATREGFRLYLARRDGTVCGLVLAVLARPGDWWRDQVAAAIGPERTVTCLGDSCVEVVHVAVDPMFRSRGTGTALMEALHREGLAPRGVLSVHPSAEPAQHLYLRTGWTVIDNELRLGDAPPTLLMSRGLPRPRPS